MGTSLLLKNFVFSICNTPEHYNAQTHSILGISPLERFALDRNRIRYLPPNETNDELFFVEQERHVRADNTFYFLGARYEAPRHLANRAIQVRHRRSDKNAGAPLIVYYKNERMGRARLVNLVANDRKPLKTTPPQQTAGIINNEPAQTPHQTTEVLP